MEIGSRGARRPFYVVRFCILTCNRTVITDLLHMNDPEKVAKSDRQPVKQKRSSIAGVNDVWSQDQHNKWGSFGIWLHASIELFSGEINWIKIWWTNSDPRLIVRYYLDMCRKIGGT